EPADDERLDGRPPAARRRRARGVGGSPGRIDRRCHFVASISLAYPAACSLIVVASGAPVWMNGLTLRFSSSARISGSLPAAAKAASSFAATSGGRPFGATNRIRLTLETS